MKLKEYNKIYNDIRYKYINDYCEEHGINVDEYKNAEKKQYRIFWGIYFFVLTVLCLIGIIGSVVKYNDDNVSNSTNSGVIVNTPSCAFGNGSYTTLIHNNLYDNLNLYTYNGGAIGSVAPQSYDEWSFYPDLNYTHFSSDSEFVLLQDYNGSLGYGSNVSVVTETLGDNDLRTYYYNVFDTYYLDFIGKSLAYRNEWSYYLLGSHDYSTKLNLSGYIDLGNFFRLSFITAYDNLNRRNFNRFYYTYTNYPSVNLSNSYEFDLYAQDTNGFRVKIASNVYGDNVKMAQNEYYLTYGVSNPVRSYDDLYFAPYLTSNAVKIAFANETFDLSDGDLEFLPFLSPRETRFIKIDPVVDNKYSDMIWGGVGDLFKTTLTSLMPITNIYILPGITIGGLIFAPLVITFVVLIITLLKKG